MNNAILLREAMDKSGSRVMSTVHIKKDGTERITVFNPKHIGTIKGTGHPIKDPEAKANLFKVMDLTLNPAAWRSIDARRLIRIRVGGDEINTSVEEEA